MTNGTEGATKAEAVNEVALTKGRTTRPGKQGLYDPAYEHDACGVGFVVGIQGRKTHKIQHQGLQVLTNLLPPGPLSSALERVAPFGLFIVLGLIVTGLFSSLIGRPVAAVRGLIASVFGLPVG